MPRLELRLLGSPTIDLEGAPAEGFAIQKARGLLIYLAIEARQAHTRESLVGLLWPDVPEAAARANLRQALANLREAIADEQASPPFLSIRRDSLQFNPASEAWTDVDEFNALLDTCQVHSHRHSDRCASCARRRARAIELYRGDFLAGFHLREADPFEEWSAIQRERMRRRVTAALARQATYHEVTDDREQALAMVDRQLELDPWMEEAHRERMRLLALAGRRSEALAQFEVCRRVLHEELGAAPSSETVRLHARIREAGDEGLAEPSVARPESLPQPSTPFVGRARELAELMDLLEDPGHRLITVMGGGGVGKSRLALEAAREVRSAFGDQVAFVRLEALGSAAQLPSAILSVLGPGYAGPGDPMDGLLDSLREREVLLVLDSPEGLLPAVRGAVTLILDLAPRVAVLVTSVERLGLQAEVCYALEGLEVAAEDLPAEAVALFLERARRIQRQVGAGEGEMQDIQRICRLVEGIPLAIELAASAVDRRSCREIADELEADIAGLTSRHHDLPDRHRSLAAALEFSWSRLGEKQREILCGLSVFRGGWDVRAAGCVASAEQADLMALVDRSLIRQDQSGRFAFHALMQEHASAQLMVGGEATNAQRRHLGCFSELAAQAEPKLLGPEQIEWLPRVDAELANLRQALSWAMEYGELEAAARLCLSLARYWMIRGLLAEGQQTLERLLTLAGPVPAELRVRLFNRAGILAAMLRRFDEAEPHLRASVDLARQQGDTQGEAMSLNSLGAMSIERGDYAAARRYLELCLPAWKQLDNANGLASTLNNLGAVALLAGEQATARQRFEESLPLFRELGDRRMIAGVLYNLGDLCLQQGDVDGARRDLRQSLELRHQIGEVAGVAEALEGFGRLSVAEGKPADAARLLGAASKMRETVGAPLAPVNQAEYDRAVERARQLLGEEAYHSAWRAGSELAPEQAVGLTQAV